MAAARRDRGRAHMLAAENVAPATRLLEKRRQMFEVQEALDMQKGEYSRREEAFRRREEGLRKKDLELQTSLIHYNKVITNNEAKRQRALQRAAQESSAKDKKESEIHSLSAQLASEKQRLTAVDDELRRISRYRRFLALVKDENPEDFEFLGQIRDRYRDLQRANEKLSREQRDREARLREARAELDKLRATEVTATLTQTIEASSLTEQFQRTRRRTDELGQLQEQRAAGRVNATRELKGLLASVNYLFGRCVTSHAAQVIRYADKGLKDEIEDLQKGQGAAGHAAEGSKDDAADGGSKAAAAAGAGAAEAPVGTSIESLVHAAELQLGVVQRFLEGYRQIRRAGQANPSLSRRRVGAEPPTAGRRGKVDRATLAATQLPSSGVRSGPRGEPVRDAYLAKTVPTGPGGSQGGSGLGSSRGSR